MFSFWSRSNATRRAYLIRVDFPEPGFPLIHSTPWCSGRQLSVRHLTYSGASTTQAHVSACAGPMVAIREAMPSNFNAFKNSSRTLSIVNLFSSRRAAAVDRTFESSRSFSSFPRRKYGPPLVVYDVTCVHVAEMDPGLPFSMYPIVAVTTAIGHMLRCLSRKLLLFIQGWFRQAPFRCDIARRGQVGGTFLGAWTCHRWCSCTSSQLAEQTHCLPKRRTCSWMIHSRAVLMIRLKQHDRPAGIPAW
jgi:hypothetical protein